MAMIKVPATEPSLTAIQAALGLSGVTNYGVLMRPDLFGFGDLVNFWAKYQPLDAPILHRLTESAREAYAYGIKDDWHYNLNDSTRGPVQAYNNALNGTFSLWREKPTGDIDVSPFRPWDYYSYDGTKGYNSEAVPPFSFEEEALTYGELYITARLLNDYELPDGNITISDLQKVDGPDAIITKNTNTCFGLLYKKDSDNTVYVAGANGEFPAFMENGDVYTSGIQVAGNGKYTVVYILLNKQNGRFITLPITPKTFIVDSSSVYDVITVGVNEPMWNNGKTAISFSLLIESQSPTFHTIQSAVAKLRFVGKSYDAAMEAGEYEFAWNPSSIDAKATLEKAYTQIIPSSYRNRSYQVMFKVIINGVEPFLVTEEIDDSSQVS